MPNLMQNAAEWLGDRLKTAAGRTVTIRQGRTTLADVTGWCSMHSEVVDNEVLPQAIRHYQWSFKADDLGGLEFRDGAVITETLNGQRVSYQVMSNDSPAAFSEDTSKILVTVRTKIICEDDA